MSKEASVSEMVSTHFAEAVKTYSAFDGSDRLEFHYVAHVDTKDGEQCMVTQYVYDGTTTRVQKTKESKVAWDGSWDI